MSTEFLSSTLLYYIPFIIFRDFLWSFRLPGEAQKIDRMMEAFAEQYCTKNPGKFKTAGLLHNRIYSSLQK